jgi:phosphatidylglycerophosphatase GEP4
MTSWFNISGTLSAFRLLRDPSLCLPHHTVPTFAHLPVPVSPALAPSNVGDEKSAAPDIRAVVLDKDNCFAVPHSNGIYPAYKVGIDWPWRVKLV